MSWIGLSPFIIRSPNLASSNWEGSYKLTVSKYKQLLILKNDIEKNKELISEMLYKVIPDLKRQTRREALNIKRYLFNNYTPLSHIDFTNTISILESKDQLVFETDHKLRESYISLKEQIWKCFVNESFTVKKWSIQQIVSNHQIREGIYLSSKDFYNRIKSIDYNLITKHEKKEINNFFITLFRYLSRSTWKATPHSYFSMVSRGDWGCANDANLDFSGITSNTMISRYIQEGLIRVLNEIERETSSIFTKNNINPTLSNKNNTLVFWKNSINKSGLISIPITPVFQEVINLIENDDEKIINSNYFKVYMLLKRIGVIQTRYPTKQELSNIRRTTQGNPIINLILEIFKDLIKINYERNFNKRIELYEYCRKNIRLVLDSTKLTDNQMFILDAARNLKVTLDNNIINRVGHALDTFNSIKQIYSKDNPFENFLAKFEEKFGCDVPIDIMEVEKLILDGELYLPEVKISQIWTPPTNNDNLDYYNKFINFIYKEVNAAKKKGETKIFISDYDLLKYTGLNKIEMKEAFGVRFNVISLDSDYLVHLNSITSVGHSTWRFSNFFNSDSELSEAIKTGLPLLSDGCEYATVAFLSGHEGDNLFRDCDDIKYVIEFDSISNLPPHRKIPANDLTLTLSEQDKKLILASKSKGIQIKPLFFTPSIIQQRPAIQILEWLRILNGNLQPLQKPSSLFPWEIASEFHMPRIICGTWVLSRERWSFAPKSLKWVTDQKNNNYELILLATELRMKRKIPEKVFVRTDTESSPTPIDLTNPWCIRSLRKLVEVSSQWVIFEEMLPNEEDELFESSDKNYVVEIDGIFKKVQNRKL